ncbi:ABC transporter ATP-binding protein [Heliorestis acidaminivorans]|uniref:ABC-type quaternary amine transporter n=1 Tax=Heliorestis acidaminivorans TaxID=553427 RepID=A0A6I0EN85_9FIRM|nr:ABC transporter ATP-binding protein [Heliorestis acidaminivorans]KAB2951166.1 ABC transporter ATP-binding protein [Heliorestis acidaminivorans]
MFDIELLSVTKKYAGTEKAAVQGLCLSVEKGQILTLLGPSGCGKTTTLRLIAGFERPDQGKITLRDRVVSHRDSWIPPEKRDIGMVFQDYALFPHLNVIDNVGFGYRGTDKKGRVQEVLQVVNLQGFEKRFPHELSGGQQQRVALARALARKPVVILLDEPFSNLDAELRVQMRVEVKEIIKDAGATAVFVTHDQKDALAISDRIVVMKDGVIQQSGTPREIYQYPETPFVATFVGQSNLLPGQIGDDGQSVITEIGQVPCNHTHNLARGEKCYISIRPDSLEVDPEGSIVGKVKQWTYTGESIDAVVDTVTQKGTNQELLVHIHPEKIVQQGEILRFKVLPNFVAVLRSDREFS